ncbi:uncharacterized protein CMU_021340 [Cryptosporidium muris RN66]|uniref:Uncharacterized protein n=1 Tax=Cryptosporidium muris (strain RN66) TaxID=441375 RepID=B6AJI0_CRYMR|nr:uncharacterized protein CMU_021340 [Cryptosporidium muris RN66]EEA08371.1 hypothetical protein, conserved [Cryptosporidium muris RN66]|eukprot:XP_002142720.1 hypothetical protein [Cryptosporidium muris RN66]
MNPLFILNNLLNISDTTNIQGGNYGFTETIQNCRLFLFIKDYYKLIKKNFYLIFCMLGLLLSSVVNSVYFKKMTNAMPNHVWFLTQLISGLYVPFFGIIVLILYLKNNISDETLKIPLRKFWIMGFLDSFGSILTLLASVHTSGVMQVILGQFCTPITLIMLTIFCKDKFHIMQYLGAFIMIIGIFIVKSAVILGFRDISESDKSNYLVFNILFIISCIPASASSVYKDMTFRETSSLNEHYLQFNVALAQVIIGFFLAPINSIPILGPLKIEITEIPSLLGQGLRCLFLKQNIVTTNCGNDGQRSCDMCELVQLPVLIYFIANIICNIFSIMVIKHGSAATGFIVSTMRLPLTTFVFFSSTLVGKEATTPHIEDFIGIFILVCGLILYRFGATMNYDFVEDSYELNYIENYSIYPNYKELDISTSATGNEENSLDSYSSTYYSRL